MPTLHRLATLRDDVIFFFYLYQSYAYKVDHTRMNEFGQGGDDEEVEEKVAAKPLAASSPGGGDASVDTNKEVAEAKEVMTTASGSDKGSGSAKKRR